MALVLACIALACILGGAVALTYQAYLYLKWGTWVAFPITEFCAERLHIQWCAEPTDWLGLHQTLSSISLAGACAIIAFVVALILAAAEGT